MTNLNATFILIFMLVTGLAAQTKTNIAVLRLDPIEISDQEAQVLTRKLSSELVKLGVYNVLDRGEMEAILQEQGFQQTGCTSSECAVEVGQLLGVQKMVAGSVGRLGSIYYTEVRMIDVQSSRIERTVDHNQEGTIEKVLTVSIPYIASTLSGITVAEPKNATDDATLFVEAVAQKSVDTVVEAPVVEKKVTLWAHHNHGVLFVNDSLISKDSITITAVDTPIIVHEKKWFYSSKPDTVNLTKLKGNQFGVGGRRSEAVLSAGYFTARNGESYFPAARLSAGGMRQSAITNELSLIIGDISGLSVFTDIPDSSTRGKTETVVLGGFYEWLYDWELAEILKLGVGFNTGFLFVREQSHTGREITGMADSLYLRHDLASMTFGGPKVRAAMGWKRVFVESMVSFQMGIRDEDVLMPDYLLKKWVEVETLEMVKIDGAKSEQVFHVLPMLSLNLLFTL